MDCKRFLNQHALLIDERCSALEENEMRGHMRVCAACARHDTAIRRSLMLVKSIPDIEPSPDFQARLEARLRAGAQPMELRRPRLGRTVYVAIAATVVFVTAIASGMLRGEGAPTIRMHPVVATVPETEPSLASTALVASIATGMSVWPAIMAAHEARIHFVAAEMASQR